MRKWEDLPKEMQNDEIRYYYDILSKKIQLSGKRVFDILVSATLLLTLSWLFFILAIVIKLILLDLYFIDKNVLLVMEKI